MPALRLTMFSLISTPAYKTFGNTFGSTEKSESSDDHNENQIFTGFTANHSDRPECTECSQSVSGSQANVDLVEL